MICELGDFLTHKLVCISCTFVTFPSQVVNGEWRGAGAPVYREDGNAANKYYASFNGKASYSDADNVISEQPVYVARQGCLNQTFSKNC